MRIILITGLLMLAVVCAGGCVSRVEGDPPEPRRDDLKEMRQEIKEVAARKEHRAPEVKVQHILIKAKGGKSKSVEEAEKKAAEILGKIRKGANFKTLLLEYTEDPINPGDSDPGAYTMVAKGRSPRGRKGVRPRTGMVAAFGDVGWRLKVGEVGVAPYDERKSPYGWHIIKRLK